MAILLFLTKKGQKSNRSFIGRRKYTQLKCVQVLWWDLATNVDSFPYQLQ